MRRMLHRVPSYFDTGLWPRRALGFGTLALCWLFAVFVTVPGSAQPHQEDVVTIRGGVLRMGGGAEPDEQPRHDVSIATFLIDRFPVTNAEFSEFLNQAGLRSADGRRHYDDDDNDARIHRREGRLTPDPGFADHPVVEASWFGARNYCAWRRARLPTEAEWEFAARGLEGRDFPWGREPPHPGRARFASGWNQTAPIGSHPAGATPDGVQDLAGNVHEWTSSLYRSYPYRFDDGREDRDSGEERVTRGGAHDSSAARLSAIWRGKGVSRSPQAGHHNIGFRCARDMP